MAIQTRRSLTTTLIGLGLAALLSGAPSAGAETPSALGRPQSVDQSVTVAVLSTADVARYKEIFDLQEDGENAQVDRLIRELDNPLLVGHVLALRYTAEQADRPRYADLTAWLSENAELPSAARIYALALKVKPRGKNVPMPDRPEARIFRKRASEGVEPLTPRSMNPRLSRAFAKIRDLVRDERPSEALAFLNNKANHALFGTNERDDALALIAASFYAEGVDDRALDVASGVARTNRREVPMADWTAGLAAWRLGKQELAATHFDALAQSRKVYPSIRSAGAFWAARGYLATRAPERVATMLERAAQYPRSFYGILALRQLGRDLPFDWRFPELEPDDYHALLNDRGIQRGIALWQVGQRALAEAELFRAHGRLQSDQDKAFLALAGKMDLPAVAIEATECLSTSGYDAGRYPIPQYAPSGGFTLDRALLYAFMRQESRFKTQAESTAGAQGLMQIMPKTASTLTNDRSLLHKQKVRLLDPSYNLALAQTYLQKLMRGVEPQGNLAMLAIAYNGGPGNLQRWRKNLGLDNDPLLFIESIPVPETREYIEHVLTNYWAYRVRFGESIASLDAAAAGNWPLYRN